MATITHVHDLCNENARDLSVYSTDLKDSELDEAFNTVNKGTNQSAQIGRGAGKSADEYRLIALYDLQNAVPASGVIMSAYWHLYINANTLAVGPSYSWEINRVTRYDWHEGWVTWDNYKQNTPWTNPGADYSTPTVLPTVPLGQDKWFTNDVTDIVTDARSNRDDIVNMLFRRTDGLDAAGIVTVFTKQNEISPYGSGTYAPHLRVTYTLDGRTFQVMVR